MYYNVIGTCYYMKYCKIITFNMYIELSDRYEKCIYSNR